MSKKQEQDVTTPNDDGKKTLSPEDLKHKFGASQDSMNYYWKFLEKHLGSKVKILQKARIDKRVNDLDKAIKASQQNKNKTTDNQKGENDSNDIVDGTIYIVYNNEYVNNSNKVSNTTTRLDRINSTSEVEVSPGSISNNLPTNFDDDLNQDKINFAGENNDHSNNDCWLYELCCGCFN
ncbi:MAG: hypothetical protein HRU35_04185 [Rickettsiaceae bacterium]|nr:hypothetical protein [Rickettsiaceae bacterium]